MQPSMSPCLLAVVEVDKADRVICQADGCGHSVYKRIHVVRDKGRITVIGSECFKRLYGDTESVSHKPIFGSAEGRRLSQEERDALLRNTEQLIATLELEHNEAEKRRVEERLEAERLAIEHRKLMASRVPQAGGRFGGYGRSRIPPVIDILAGVSESELAKLRLEAKVLLQAENPGVNLDSPGWSGLVEAEVRRIVRRRRYGASAS